MSVEQTILLKVAESLTPTQVQIENESHKHSAQLGLESHFKLLIVSEGFQGLSRVARQRNVHSLLAKELAEGVHALSLRLMTPEEWAQKGAEGFVSPNCSGQTDE